MNLYDDIVVIQSPFTSGSNNIRYYRTGAAIHCNSRDRDQNELLTMMVPSWRYVNSLSYLSQEELQNHPQIQFESNDRVTIDLLLFCEPMVCDTLPIDCISMNRLLHNKSIINFKTEPAKCYYHPLNKSYQHESLLSTQRDYPFILSLVFLTQKPFLSIYKMYDFILRTDMDALIAPLSLVWKPPNNYSFGHSYMSSTFAQRRLEYVARKLHLKHAKVHDLHSTFYAHTKKFSAIANMTVNMTEYLYLHTARMVKRDPLKIKEFCMFMINNGTFYMENEPVSKAMTLKQYARRVISHQAMEACKIFML
eukprot:391065_1